MSKKLRIQYNAPVVLTFAIVCSVVLVVSTLTGDAVVPYFVVGPTMNFGQPADWFRLVSHVLGHDGVGHLMGNMMLLLLLGPILEEKYGSRVLAGMILVTALVTGVLVLLFHGAVMGASGIVFMLILLSSFTNVREGHIPLTFVLVVVLYLGQEVFNSLRADSVSQLAHIGGGLCGAAFGFALERK